MKRWIIVWLAWMVFGCASTSMYVPVMKPARVNLGGVKKIAIGEFTGPAAADFSDELTMLLFQSQRYDVLDRQHLNRILAEHNLSYSGLVDKATTVNAGEFLGSAALIFGRVSKHSYDEDFTSEDWEDQKGNFHRTFTRTGNAHVAVTLQITDLTTGKIIAIRNITETAEQEEQMTDEHPPRIDSNALLKQARAKALKVFMQDIAPYQVKQKVTLLKDDNIPKLQDGIAMVKMGNWYKARTLFWQATQDHPQNAKALFNLGVAYEYTFEFDRAIKSFEKAYELENNKLYLKELTRCQNRQREHQRLQEQQQQVAM